MFKSLASSSPGHPVHALPLRSMSYCHRHGCMLRRHDELAQYDSPFFQDHGARVVHAVRLVVDDFFHAALHDFDRAREAGAPAQSAAVTEVSDGLAYCNTGSHRPLSGHVQPPVERSPLRAGTNMPPLIDRELGPGSISAKGPHMIRHVPPSRYTSDTRPDCSSAPLSGSRCSP